MSLLRPTESLETPSPRNPLLGGRQGLADNQVEAPPRVEATGGAFAAFSNYNYRLYFFGQLISQSGSWLQRIAQSWLVLTLTDSPTALGIVTALQFLPITVLSLFAGVVADRVPRRALLFVITGVATVQAAALAVLTITGTVQLWHVYVLAFILGVDSAFEMPTRQAFVGQLVVRDELQSAVALNSSMFNAARIVGPGLGGVMIATVGVGWCFGLNALSYVAVLITLVLLRTDRLQPLRRPPRGAVWGQLINGLRYAAQSPDLRFPLILLGFLGLFGYNWGVTLPLLARYGLDIGPQGFGALNAAMGVGSLIGAVALATHVAPSRRWILLTAAGFSVAFLGVAVTPWFLLALGLLVILGVLSTAYSASTNTLLQLESNEDYRGRVLSLYTLLFAGTTPLGGALTGFLADAWGIRAALIVEGGVCLAAAVGGAVYLVLQRRRA